MGARKKGMAEAMEYLGWKSVSRLMNLEKRGGLRPLLVERVSGERNVVVGIYEEENDRFETLYDPYGSLGYIKEYVGEYAEEVEEPVDLVGIMETAEEDIGEQIWNRLPEEVRAITSKRTVKRIVNTDTTKLTKDGKATRKRRA